MYNENGSKYNENGTDFSPSIAWYKDMATADGGDDFKLNFKDNLTVYWKLKDGQDSMGFFEGFYLDDPLNPVITGAKTLIAGTISVAALLATQA
jgi:hypothetical protein